MDKFFDKFKIEKQLILVLVWAVLVSFLLFKDSVNAPPLLDEHYILMWLKQCFSGESMIAQNFSAWHGAELGDTFSVISGSLLGYLANLSGFSTNTIRTFSVILHVLNVVLVYKLIDYALSPRPAFFFQDKIKWMAIMTAFCFSIYPVIAEPIFWIGGIAYSTGLALLLLSFICYFQAKKSKSWKYIFAGALLYLVALFTDTSIWSAGFILVGLELSKNFIGPKSIEAAIDEKTIEQTEDMEDAVEKLLELEKESSEPKYTTDAKPETEVGENESKEDKDSSPIQEPANSKESEENVFDTVLPTLPYLALGAIIPLGRLPKTGSETLANDMIIQASDWINAFKAFAFPINESITLNYNPQYSFLYILYGIGLLAVPFALVKSRIYRQHLVFLAIWLIMALVPHLHHAITNDTMVGCRWFYHASVPICAIIVLYFSSINFIKAESKEGGSFIFKSFGTLFSCITVGILLFFMFKFTQAQLRAYTGVSKMAQKLRFSVNAVSAKSNIKDVIVRNVPYQASITRTTSPFNLILFDGKTQLVRTPYMVGSSLKEKLKEGPLKKSTFYFQHNYQSLYPIEYGVIGKEEDKPILDAKEIEKRAIPPFKYSSSIKLSDSANLVELFSNIDAGPVLTVSSNGFNPLGEDFVYVDAKIVTPNINPDDQLTIVWYTTWGEELELRDRISKARAITNDGKFHRYYFPVRSTAWATNGKIKKISFNFPKFASVEVKEIGQIEAPERIPSLVFKNSQAKPNKPSFSSGCYSFPDNSEDRLHSSFGEDNVLEFSYDVSSQQNAKKAICEISIPNKKFENPNGYKLSKNKLKLLHLKQLKGTIKVKAEDLKESGIYSFRVFATDENEDPILNASDDISCLVDKSISLNN